jgi:hypothetical protein
MLPVNAFKRHFMALGGSGSGKTVLCKCVIEEAVRNNIPVIIIDPQGDISSLAIKGNPEELTGHGTSLDVQQEFFSKARIAIFTPASNKAIPISVNPFKSPSQDIPHEDAIQTIDLTATSLASFLGYDINADAGKSAKAYMFTILEHLWQQGQRISDMSHLAHIVLNPPAKIAATLNSLVAKKEPEEIARKLRFLTVGTSSVGSSDRHQPVRGHQRRKSTREHNLFEHLKLRKRQAILPSHPLQRALLLDAEKPLKRFENAVLR